MELYTRLMTWIADFKEREDGVTAIEYGLLAAAYRHRDGGRAQRFLVLT